MDHPIDIKELIPHRDPILLVDEIVEVKKFEFIKAKKIVNKNEEVFKGHFPGHPVWPGVYAIEAVAQAGACLVNLSLKRKAKDTIFYFMSVDSAKFRMPIGPEDVLDIEVKKQRQRGTVFKFEGVVSVSGKLAAEVTFTAKAEDI